MTNLHSFGGGRRPAGPHHTGALVLALLALAAFCGWYLVEQDWPDDSAPLRVVQKPIMPPTTETDTSSEMTGHTHYTIMEPQEAAGAPKKP